MSSQIVVGGRWSGLRRALANATHSRVLDAFGAFAPEAIGMETLAHETGLSQAVVAECLIEMARRKEIIVTTEFVVVANGGKIVEQVYLPWNHFDAENYSVTMYRVNDKHAKEAA